MLCMARSKSREVTTTSDQSTGTKEAAPNPVWFKPLMFGFMLLGLAWLLTYYISGSQFPLPQLGNNNIWIGIGIMLVGFLMTTRWR
jgi:hypothetical protein